MLEEDGVIPFQFPKALRRGGEMPHSESHWNTDYLRETKGRLERPQELRRQRAKIIPKKARQESPWRQLYEKSHRMDLSLRSWFPPHHQQGTNDFKYLCLQIGRVGRGVGSEEG